MSESGEQLSVNSYQLMKNISYIIFFIPFLLFGQNKLTTPYKLNYVDTRIAKSSFQPVNSDSIVTENSVIDYLKQNISNLNSSEHSLKLTHRIESPIGIHFTYIQLYKEVPVYRSQIKVNVDKKGNILSVFDNSYNISGFNITRNNLDSNAILNFVQKNFSSNTKYFTEKMIFMNASNAPFIVYKIQTFEKSPATVFETLIDEKNKIIYQQDLCSYIDIQDSLVDAMVFLPDPLTTAGVTYGAPYVDAGDSDIVELNAQRVAVKMSVTFNTGTFFLINSFVAIKEIEDPNAFPVNSSMPVFNYTRAQSGFEDVNAYYHLNVFQTYVQSLGFMNLMNEQVEVDPHGYNGTDNSRFVPGTTPMLIFGEGGVDDAEDADVLIHEYGHAISNSAAPGSNNGTERLSLDEGFGDYLAASYSRSINPFKWENVFSWDGHNPYFDGRTAASTKHYPEDFESFDIHASGEIWSSVLMQIWEDIGKATTDKLVLQSMYSYVSNMSMSDAALLIVQADSILNSGINRSVLYTRFVQRGLLQAPPDLLIVLTSSKNVSCNEVNDGEITVIPYGGNSPFTFRWSTGETTQTISNLSAGSYRVTTTDALGVFTYTAITLKEPDVLFVGVTSQNATCIGKADGSSTASVYGGTAPYKYTWSTEDSSQAIKNILAGTYTLVVTDANGCMANSSFTLTSDYALCTFSENIMILNSDQFASGDYLTIAFKQPLGSVSIELFDIQGRIIKKGTFDSSSPVFVSGKNLSSGLYFINIRASADSKIGKVVRY